MQNLLIKNIHEGLGVPDTDINNVVGRARCLSQNLADNDDQDKNLLDEATNPKLDLNKSQPELMEKTGIALSDGGIK
jgi:hypothetical protein